MTGSEHYKESERLLIKALEARSYEQQQTFYSAAQIHTTLALAAVTQGASKGVAMCDPGKEYSGDDLFVSKKDGCYTLPNGECIGTDCIHTLPDDANPL